LAIALAVAVVDSVCMVSAIGLLQENALKLKSIVSETRYHCQLT
jgi:hypothetical protein